MNDCLYCNKPTADVEISAADKAITLCAPCYNEHFAEPDFEAKLLKAMGLR